MIWLSLLIPTILVILALTFFTKKITWWESMIPFVSTLIVVLIFKYAGISSLTHDKEYLGYHIIKINYYEPWNEWITMTCTRSVPCGTDKDGNTQWCTETYDCSYCQHHSEEWSVILNSSKEKNISQTYYNYLKQKFGTKSYFVDMNRDYYTEDGDCYSNDWNGSEVSYEDYIIDRSYENRVQASASIFNFPNVDTSEFRKYSLYDYPKFSGIDGTKLKPILHPKTFQVSESTQRKFEIINGTLGIKKQVRVWILIYDNKDRNASFLQRSLWKGGNKNEFIITIGLDKEKKVDWVEIITWGEKKMLDVRVKDYLIESDSTQLNLDKFAPFLYKEIDQHWVRKSFKDFEYLNINPPNWAIITSFIVSIISCLFIFFWSISNEFDMDGNKEYGRYRY